MSQLVRLLRAYASPVEFAWSACALVGLLVGLFVLREAWLSLVAVRGGDDDMRREALRDYRTALAFVLIFLSFSEIGLASVFAPPPVYASNRRVADLLGFTLLIAEPLLVWAKWANWRDQRAALGRAERREGRADG